MSALKWGLLLGLTGSVMSTASGAPTRVLENIEYARAGGESLRLDATIPEGAGPFPAAILVHGGAWVRGDRRTEVAPLFAPLHNAGIAWFSISYRLMKDALQFGVAIADVEAAVRFVKAHAAEYHVDPNRIALIGESAGGQLAAMAALHGAGVKAVVALYTPADLISLYRTSDMIPPAIRQNVQGTPWESLVLARLAELSPIEKIRRDMPPFLLIHGTADPLVPLSQSVAMCERMKAAGASCDLYTVQGAGHAIKRWESSPALASGYKREVVRWLKEKLGA
jgi:acetyl esterase/lipase